MQKQLQELIQLPVPPPPPSPLDAYTHQNQQQQPPASPSPARGPSGKPLIRKVHPRLRCGEVAGGTAAGCAAVCCCCPCALVDLLVLAMVRLPAGLCRRAMRARRKRKRAGLLRSRVSSIDNDDFGIPRAGMATALPWPAKSPSAEVLEREREMWDQFHRAGFWRSPSQAHKE